MPPPLVYTACEGVADSQDVAKADLWLASDASDYVVGTTQFVDGGLALYPALREKG